MYVQKGTQRIEVIVRGEGVWGEGEQGTDGVSNRGRAGQKQWAKKRASRIAKLNLIHAFSQGISIAKRKFHYDLSGLGYQYGDQAYQAQQERQVEIFEDITGSTTDIVAGAMYGSFGGPVGMAIGAALGLTKSVADLWFKYAEREREYNYKVAKQENSIEYMRARARINLTFGRLR